MAAALRCTSLCYSSPWLPRSRLFIRHDRSIRPNVKNQGRITLTQHFSTDSRDVASASQRQPRIDLSRRQLRGFWDKDEPLSRIVVDPENFPLELFDTTATLPKQPNASSQELSSEVAGNIQNNNVYARYEHSIESYIFEEHKSAMHLYESVDKAHKLLLKWHEEWEPTGFPVPTWYAHRCVMKGWQKVGYDGAKGANDVLQLLLNLLDRDLIERDRSLKEMYDTVLKLWTITKNPTGSLSSAQSDLGRVSQAIEVLEERECRSQEGHLDLKPDEASYNIVLNVLGRISVTASKAGFIHWETRTKKHATNCNDIERLKISEAAATRASSFIQRMEERYDTTRIAPDLASYKSVLTAWVHVHTTSGAAQAHEWLNRMEQTPHVKRVNVICYSAVLNAYVKVAHLQDYDINDTEAPANKAHSILMSMEERLHRAGSGGTDNLPIVSLPQSNQSDEISLTANRPTGTTPDQKCYSAVIDAFARSRVPADTPRPENSPAVLALSVLDRMEMLHQSGVLCHKPNVYCFAFAIRAWSNHRHDITAATINAESLLDRMENCLHTTAYDVVDARFITTCYNQVLNLLVESTLEGSAQRADMILTRMEKSWYSNDNSSVPILLEPDVRSYEAVIEAWNLSKDDLGISRATSAVQCLQRLVNMYHHQLQVKKNRPPLQLYSEVLPILNCYNEAISACAATSGDESVQREALRLARQVFDDLAVSPHCKPSSRTFYRMMNAHSRLLPPGSERDDGIEEFFNLCCDRGLVSFRVLKALLLGGSKKLLAKIVGPRYVREAIGVIMNALPPGWRANAERDFAM